jgi:predicted Zn-dependent protease
MIRRLRAAAALAAATGLLSCGEIGAPLRSEFYEWRLVDAGTSASFHWSRDDLPVRFWAQDIYDLDVHTQGAIDTWKAAFLYREFDGIMVADSADADVIVRAGFPDGGGILQTRITECEALTELDLDIEARTLTLPIHVFIAPRFNPELPETKACFGVAMIHEVGHAIGIFRHSPDQGDIMYFSPVVTAPSERDRQTAEVLYHSDVNVTIERGGAP